jgi:tetratricopeptide (TPR) repeat protein
MVSRASLVGVVLAGIAGIAVAQSPGAQMGAVYPGAPGLPGQMGQPWNTAGRSVNSVVGSVHSDDNLPMDNVRVELRDASTGVVLGSSYTGIGGNFEFRELPQGSYEVVAFAGAQKAEEHIQVNSMSTSVQLRLPARASDGLGNRTVSVSQYRVPEKSREELKKAEEASAKNKREDALRHLARALEICPNYADALTVRATYKLDGQDFAGAIDDLEKAIQSDGNYSLAYAVLGSALNVQNKFDDALHALQRAETLSPDVWQTHFEMARAYTGQNDYQASLRSLTRAEELAPNDYPLFHLLRAHDLIGLGHFSDAVNVLQPFIQKNPRGPYAEGAKKLLEQAQESMATARK